LPHPEQTTPDGQNDVFYGYVEKGSSTASACYGGNIEVTPPVRGYPFGRTYVGSNLKRADMVLYDFLASQRLQAKRTGTSTYDLIEIDVDWLSVGHVDEIMTFVPTGVLGGFGTLLAHPERAYNLLAKAPANRAVFYKPGSKEAHGKVVSATATSLTVDITPPPGFGNLGYLRIYRGAGQGQVARVIDWTGNTILISNVWDLPNASYVFIGTRSPVFSNYGWLVQPNATSMFTIVEDCQMWRDGNGAPFPALMIAEELVQDSWLWGRNFQNGNDNVQYRIWDSPLGPRQKLDDELGKYLNVKKFPLFYMSELPLQDADAMSPNVVNMLVFNRGRYYLFIGQPLGPRRTPGDDSTDLLRMDVENITTKLNCTPVFVDTWDYHIREGNSHCGTNVRLTSPQTTQHKFRTWWERWPE